MNRLILLLATAAWPASLAAQEMPGQPMGDEDENLIVVEGQRLPGSVIGDIPPENVLDARDIRATGATSIAELVEAVSEQTGSARGRGGGRPVFLIDGERISGWRELRDFPPEAIQRMEILPEEVALKYGYSADQRVINFVLRPRFDATTVELEGGGATDGGWHQARGDITKLVIRDGNRTSVNIRAEGNNPLYESERDIALDPAAPVDERGARTLVGRDQSLRLTGTHRRKLAGEARLTLTAEAGVSDGRSRFGLADFDPSSILTRDSLTHSLGFGSILNTRAGDWRLSASATADADWSSSDTDRTTLAALTDDKSETLSTTLLVDGTAIGPLATLPAGDMVLTAKAELTRTDLESRARRRDIFSSADLGRTRGTGSFNFDLPLLDRDSTIGRFGLNANAAVSDLSDFGTLVSYGGGVSWAPSRRLNVIASFTQEEGAPSLQQLGNPFVATDNVPFFDAVNGETVDVTTLTGGNPNLSADSRTVWKIGGNWRVTSDPELRLRAEFVSQTIDNPQVDFPAVTPALEAAFPGRFVRDLAGSLVSVDLRPVNADRSRRDQFVWGLNFSKSIQSARPSPEQIQRMRQRFTQAGGGQPSQSSTPPRSEGEQQSQEQGGEQRQRPEGARRGGPGGGGGGFFGGRRGGRVNASLTHTVTTRDTLDIAPGLPTLDYLDGEAASRFGGTPRHRIEVRAGYYNNGLGIRLSGDWRSATRVDGGAGGGDLSFDDYATVDLRAFANLTERFDILAKSPFLVGSSFRIEVNNIFNARPKVRDSVGDIPFAYQPDRLEPRGRTIMLNFRKIFVPPRFFRVMREQRRQQREQEAE